VPLSTGQDQAGLAGATVILILGLVVHKVGSWDRPGSGEHRARPGEQASPIRSTGSSATRPKGRGFADRMRVKLLLSGPRCKG
jgi:hypothetical protein